MADRPWPPTDLEALVAADFVGERLRRPGRYVVCFGASWCPITRRFLPKFTEAREKLGGRLALADLTDLASPWWETFRIRITPSVIVFRDGALERRLDGRRFLGVTARALAALEAPPGPAVPRGPTVSEASGRPPRGSA